MNGAPERTESSQARNPYLPTAVAVVGEEAGHPLTIDTDSLRRARLHLDAYLDAYRPSGAQPEEGEDGRPAGNVLAIVGEHGTGKTHLVQDLIHRLYERAATHSHALYFEAAEYRSFHSIYREFMRRLQDEHDLQERVRDYYVDLAVEDLGRSPLQHRYAERLRQGATVEDVERSFGLAVPELMTALRRRLQTVTRNPDFGLALSLLLDPLLESHVKEWLLGEPPNAVLVEHGIAQAINSEDQALEALGVFALVYGQRNHRFMLVIDEIDKLLMPAGRPVDSAETGFKKLLQVFAAARGLLVIAGLADFLQVLRSDTQQRIAITVQMSALTQDQVTQYVLATHERFLGRRSLHPFTPDALHWITQVAGGVPRQVIRLLRQCLGAATATNTEVTAELALQTAPELAIANRDDVRKTVISVLNRAEIAYEMDRRVSLLPASRVDFWLPAAVTGTGTGTDSDTGTRTGCGIVVTDSVLTDDDVSALSDRAHAIRTATAGAAARLVVAGWLTAGHRDELATAFGTPPLAYHHHTFELDLLALIRAAGAGATSGTAGSDLAAVHDQLGDLAWQQGNVRRSLEQLTAAVDQLRSSSERGLAGIHAHLRHVAPDSPDPAGSGTGSGEGRRRDAPALPPPVSSYFGRARALIDGVLRLRPALDRTFEPVQGFHTGHEEGRGLAADLRRSLARPEGVAALGLLSILRELVDAFETALISWHVAWGDLDDSARPAAREALLDACRTYDEIFDVLPMHLLDAMDQRGEAWAGQPGEARTGTHGTADGRQVRRAVDDVLAELAAAARASLLASP